MSESLAKVQVLTAGGAGKQSSKGAVKQSTKNSNSVGSSSSEEEAQNKPTTVVGSRPVLEMEATAASDHQNDEEDDVEDIPLNELPSTASEKYSDVLSKKTNERRLPEHVSSHHDATAQQSVSSKNDLMWLLACFLGIMASFVCYGLLLEYTTSGGRKLHELSFLFVTSSFYTLTGAAGRYVNQETPTTMPPARFAILGLMSMGSTFCSVRSLRYVIFPIQVLAKSCKPVPVMLMGAALGKRYSLQKYINVALIVLGVALFMGGGDGKKEDDVEVEEAGGEMADVAASASQLFGVLLLFVSLCFDGGIGAYEDKLMSVYQVEPFDLMFNIQLGKTILAFIGLLVFNQLHIFLQLVQDMGFLLVALGLTGAMGQAFIFVTIAKFGALTCSIIGLARKITTLVASIYFYGHSLNSVQLTGLVISVTAMVLNFWGKKKGGSTSGHGPPSSSNLSAKGNDDPPPEELAKMLGDDEDDDEEEDGDVELAAGKRPNY